MSERARQFMPFASLRGYYDLISETQRLKEDKRELSEDDIAKLNEKLLQIKKGMIIEVVYYDVDSYVKLEGMVAYIDTTFKNITIIKTTIDFEDIFDIKGDEITY